jgi:hypothetical protein
LRKEYAPKRSFIVSLSEKKTQYILFVLMACLLLAVPAAAEALDDAGVSLTESAVNDTIVVAETPSVTPTAVSAGETDLESPGMLSESPALLFTERLP